MRILTIHIICVISLLFLSFESNSQRNNYYYGVRTGSVICFLTGAQGYLDISLRRNIVKDLKHVNSSSFGGVYPFIGANGGIFGGFYFHSKFTADMSITYTIKGYHDIFEYSSADTFYKSVDQLNAHYVDFGFKVRYVNRNFIINSGLIIGANIFDRVHHDLEYTIKDVQIIKEEETRYMHEHYGPYRKPFVLGYVWGLGYRIRKLTFLANIQKTGSIFHENAKEFSFTSYHFTFEYRFNPLDKRSKRR